MELNYIICPHCHQRIYRRQCGNCKHFIQHYGKLVLGFEKINAGHCIANSHMKNKSMLANACEQWEADGSFGLAEQTSEEG